MDKILVIIPVYNAEKWIQGAIESCLQQREVETDLIIVDDCSTDNSMEVINQYKDRDNVTILQNEENRGTYYSCNRGMDLLDDHDYFTIHGADDVSDLKRLSTILLWFDSRTLGVTSTYIRVNEELEPITPRDVYTGEGIAVYKREVFDLLGYFDDTRFAGDTDYWLRLSKYCKHNNNSYIKESPEILYLARVHENNLTKQYKVQTDRRPYFNKITEEVKQMIKYDNFYRDKFE